MNGAGMSLGNGNPWCRWRPSIGSRAEQVRPLWTRTTNNDVGVRMGVTDGAHRPTVLQRHIRRPPLCRHAMQSAVLCGLQSFVPHLHTGRSTGVSWWTSPAINWGRLPPPQFMREQALRSAPPRHGTQPHGDRCDAACSIVPHQRGTSATVGQSSAAKPAPTFMLEGVPQGSIRMAVHRRRRGPLDPPPPSRPKWPS